MKLHLACALLGLACVCYAQGQQSASAAPSESADDLKRRVQQLEIEVTELKQIVKQLQPSAGAVSGAAAAPIGVIPLVATKPAAATEQPVSSALATSVSADDRKNLDFLHDTTLNLGLDAYYEYNFNDPVGRVNLLRAYDVLSNEFSLNQASVILEHAPDVSAGRRWGGRLDLQFGQATDTLQGNPSNEPRPEICRNIFQAYGTYVVPLGKGLTVDFGKWGSSLGIEGNYTKDQMNYSRAFWFDFLPFYHMGVRVTYPMSDRLS